MKSFHSLALILVIGILLAGCSSSPAKPESSTTSPPVVSRAVEFSAEGSTPGSIDVDQQGEISEVRTESPAGAQTDSLWPDGEVQIDSQGDVEVAVTPLNLSAPGGSFNFNVGLNTHSVDLSMDLAPLATLEADNGFGVQAVSWEAPRGGHHVSGVLSFPITSEGKPLLEGASRLILKILDVDVPERTFTWSLGG